MAEPAELAPEDEERIKEAELEGGRMPFSRTSPSSAIASATPRCSSSPRS